MGMCTLKKMFNLPTYFPQSKIRPKIIDMYLSMNTIAYSPDDTLIEGNMDVYGTCWKTELKNNTG